MALKTPNRLWDLLVRAHAKLKTSIFIAHWIKIDLNKNKTFVPLRAMETFKRKRVGQTDLFRITNSLQCHLIY